MTLYFVGADQISLNFTVMFLNFICTIKLCNTECQNVQPLELEELFGHNNTYLTIYVHHKRQKRRYW